MTALRFLVDECVDWNLIAHLRNLEPGMDILIVNELGAPPKGTDDPDLLLAAEATGRTFISGDRSTMMRHLTAHYQAGHHTWGLIMLRGGFSIARLAWELQLIWVATTPDEWVDRTLYIP